MRIRFLHTAILITIFFILAISSQCKEPIHQNSTEWEKAFKPFRFGASKPHLIFQVGSRDVISHSLAYGYWLQKPQQSIQKSSTSTTYTSMFSDLRYKYQNTEQQLYVNVLNHDGQKLIWESVKDNRYHVQSQIKYNFMQGPQESEFQINLNWKQFNAENQGNDYEIFNSSKTSYKGSKYLKDFQQGNLNWFMGLSVQNHELKLINHKDYLSPTCFSLEKVADDQVNVHLEQLTPQPNGQFDYRRQQTIQFKSRNMGTIKMFGFTVNISESYQSNSYLNEFKHLVEVEKYSHLNIPRNNDSKIVSWENKQIEEIKRRKFDSKYTYVIIYGTVDRNQLLESSSSQTYPQIFITNSTDNNKQFNSKTFDILAFQNEQRLFKGKITQAQNPEDQSFIKHIIYNMLGGLAYYEGKLYTQNSIISHQHDYSFTFTPSRLIFPRSFLWDDGFHTTIMTSYKPDMVLDVLHSWFKKVDLFGWIGRQQIRGFQISSMMPDSRFIYQDVFELNPPTIIMPLIKLLQNKQTLSVETNQKLHNLLQNHFPSLEKHFRYFVKTQSHFDLAYKEDLSNTIKYRWRCKDECAKGNFMGSGLDDYPRVEEKTQVSKQHIDLGSWLWFFADGMEKIAAYLERDKAVRFYSRWKYELREKIIEECLDETDMLFKDLAVKGEKLFLDQKVTKIGYINLFPFFVGLLKTHQKDSAERVGKLHKVLSKTIEIMMDKDLLMSEGGIRSLSIADNEYASQENYWRGASWLPINFMVLRAAKKYYWDFPSESQRNQVHKLYDELRSKLTRSIQRNYLKRGYLFQNYIEGQGNRGYPFYGWTSLIASIMVEDY